MTRYDEPATIRRQFQRVAAARGAVLAPNQQQAMAAQCDLRVESLADHPELLEQAGLLRWKEWAYGAQDPAPFIEVTAKEAGRSGQLPMTLVAINPAGGVVGVGGLGPVDDDLSAAERNGRTPWILGTVVRTESRKLGVGRQLLENLQ